MDARLGVSGFSARRKPGRPAGTLGEATLDVQSARLSADHVDAGFILHALGAVPVGLSALSLLVEPFLVALPVNHPFADREPVFFRRLSLRTRL